MVVPDRCRLTLPLLSLPVSMACTTDTPVRITYTYKNKSTPAFQPVQIGRPQVAPRESDSGGRVPSAETFGGFPDSGRTAVVREPPKTSGPGAGRSRDVALVGN